MLLYPCANPQPPLLINAHSVFAIVGGVFTLISPYERAFSLADPDLSFPYNAHEKIATSTLVLVALVAPAIIILIICLLLVPGPTVPSSTPKSLIWKRKLWEWNTGWMGLALSLAIAFVITNGMKVLFGRQRPDLLSRCDPDLDNVQKYIVGGLGDRAPQGQYLVDRHICRQTDSAMLRAGFTSFPSGHASCKGPIMSNR